MSDVSKDPDGFKHISVTPAQTDVVIQAGCTAPPAHQTPAANHDEHICDSVQNQQAPSRKAYAAAEAPDEGIVTRSAASGRKAGKQKTAYKETTLEDLESSSMPVAQKIVIIAAIVLIILALVYYFVAMR